MRDAKVVDRGYRVRTMLLIEQAAELSRRLGGVPPSTPALK